MIPISKSNACISNVALAVGLSDPALTADGIYLRRL